MHNTKAGTTEKYTPFKYRVSFTTVLILPPGARKPRVLHSKGLRFPGPGDPSDQADLSSSSSLWGRPSLMFEPSHRQARHLSFFLIFYRRPQPLIFLHTTLHQPPQEFFRHPHCRTDTVATLIRHDFSRDASLMRRFF